MLTSYFKVAWRNVLRFKVYSIINVMGLSVGLAIALLSFLFINYELGYDDFHTKKDRIFKLASLSGEGDLLGSNAWPLAYELKQHYPEVEEVVYARKATSNYLLSANDTYHSPDLYFASEAFFTVFDFPFLQGNPETALTQPYRIVITETMRDRFFNTREVIGKTLYFQDTIAYSVSGVIADLPGQSHMQFDMLASFSTLEANKSFSYTASGGWGNFNVMNYLLLSEKASIESLAGKAANEYMKEENAGRFLEQMGLTMEPTFYPLDEVYLEKGLGNRFGPKGSRQQIITVATIATFILVLACINYINLTTARSSYRAREVGFRKVLGATRNRLTLQFLNEAFLVTLVAFLVAGIIIVFSLPLFNQLMKTGFEAGSLFRFPVVVSAILLVLLVSLLSGYYPAIILSRFKPVEILKGNIQQGKKGIELRRILVTFQFIISIGILIGTFLVMQQINYMQSRDLGFSKEQVLVLDATQVANHQNGQQGLLNALREMATVQSVTYTNALPGKPGWQGQWAYPESIENQEKQVGTEYMAVDEQYLNALDISLVAGRNFDPNRPADLKDGLLINEVTVKEMGWKSPEEAIGKKIVSPSGYPEGRVIGVVANYHGQGLQQEIWPKVMDYTASRFGEYIAVRYATSDTRALINQVKSAWDQYLGSYPVNFSFLDQLFGQQYQAEIRLKNIFFIFSIITLFIAGTGLAGLVSFITMVRTKEIGIRKVLGASIGSIIRKLSQEFLILSAIAGIITLPMAWYFGNQWLANFAYHMDIKLFSFVIILLLVMLITLFVAGLQTFRAAQINPVKVLKE